MKSKNNTHDLSRSYDHTPTKQSHHITLSLKLLDLGIIPRGRFTLMETKHDADCETLVTGSGLDCNCDCEIVIDGHTYLYSEFFESVRR